MELCISEQRIIYIYIYIYIYMKYSTMPAITVTLYLFWTELIYGKVAVQIV